MCNLYALRATREEMRRKFSLDVQLEFPAIWPDSAAPVVVQGADGPELVEARWGLPPWQGDRGITNVRNLESNYWRRWLGRDHRCLVPATSFCEWADTKPRKTPTWFALGDERPAFAFAGICVERDAVLRFGFLTTDANDIVAPVHPKAMPVMLTTADDRAAWLDGADAQVVQLSRDVEGLSAVAKGERRD